MRSSHFILSVFLLALVSPLSAAEESAEDIAKRVIEDKSSAYTPVDLGYTIIPDPPKRNPEEDRLMQAAIESRIFINLHMLSDKVPEKTRIAYAISVLASKRISTTSHRIILGTLDKRKNDGYLKDSQILIARLKEIKKAEQGGASDR